jgi:hypothetical protein
LNQIFGLELPKKLIFSVGLPERKFKPELTAFS